MIIKPRWTTREEDIVREYFPEASQEFLMAQLPQKTWDGIKHHASVLRVHRRNIGRFNKGQVPWIKGRKGQIKHSPEFCQGCSERMKGKQNYVYPKEHKPWHAGLTKENPHVAKMYEWRQDIAKVKEVSDKLSRVRKGKHLVNAGTFPKGHIPFNKQSRIEIMCELCSKKFVKAEKDKQRFCSVRCANTWKAKYRNCMTNPEVAQKAMRSLFKHPTNPERRLINIIVEYNLPYQYTGDGSVIIANLNPDFTNYNGAKKLLEVFGVAFHDPKRTFKDAVPLVQQEKYRKAIYASLGFDCLVLWDDEMKKMSDEEIASIIREFTKSKHKPTAQLKMEVERA